MPISIEDLNSYPVGFITHIQNNMWDFEGLIDRDDMCLTKARLRDGIKAYRPATKEYDFFREAIELLMPQHLFAYHVTRLIDINTVFANGLQTLEFEAHWLRIHNILLEHGLTSARIEEAREKLIRMYNGALGTRKGLY